MRQRHYCLGGVGLSRFLGEDRLEGRIPGAFGPALELERELRLEAKPGAVGDLEAS